MCDLIELYKFADSENVRVRYFPLPTALSCSVRVNGRYGIGIDPGSVETSVEEAERLAHELGHCVTGSVYDERCDNILIKKCEYKADKWAAHKLIPLTALNSALSNGHIEPWELAEELCVSEDFLHVALNIYRREGKLI